MSDVTSFQIVDCTRSDVSSAIESLVAAFADDSYLRYFFPCEPALRRAAAAEFFTILLEARLALGMPAKVLKADGLTRGVAMGYDTRRPPWQQEHKERLSALENQHSGLKQRFDVSDQVCERYMPKEPHYYLGVLGLHPSLQGRGAGAAMVKAYCSMSDDDPLSNGTYLETTSSRNIEFYQRCGFKLVGSDTLDEHTTLSCFYRSRPK